MIKFIREPVRKHNGSDISVIGLDVFFSLFFKLKCVKCQIKETMIYRISTLLGHML